MPRKARNKTSTGIYHVMMRGINHQNPVKAGIVDNVADYAYSSWAEYSGEVYSQARICHVEAVLRRIPFEQLKELVCTPLPESLHVMDIEDEVTRHRTCIMRTSWPRYMKPSHRIPSPHLHVWRCLRQTHYIHIQSQHPILYERFQANQSQKP